MVVVTEGSYTRYAVHLTCRNMSRMSETLLSFKPDIVFILRVSVQLAALNLQNGLEAQQRRERRTGRRHTAALF